MSEWWFILDPTGLRVIIVYEVSSWQMNPLWVETVHSNITVNVKKITVADIRERVILTK